MGQHDVSLGLGVLGFVTTVLALIFLGKQMIANAAQAGAATRQNVVHELELIYANRIASLQEQMEVAQRKIVVLEAQLDAMARLSRRNGEAE